MLALNDVRSLFTVFAMLFVYFILRLGRCERDGAPKSGTESPSASISSKASLADLFANDHHKTLAELIRAEGLRSRNLINWWRKLGTTSG
ncbi:hypothetical protein niasHT_034303 [Heterodera trifolii]|uniref:Uncharacterized protein n=1 Tax=Heterodera trifolii TaxID=157864 RepID=A0ABD2HSH0_9BILA